MKQYEESLILVVKYLSQKNPYDGTNQKFKPDRSLELMLCPKRVYAINCKYAYLQLDQYYPDDMLVIKTLRW